MTILVMESPCEVRGHLEDPDNIILLNRELDKCVYIDEDP